MAAKIGLADTAGVLIIAQGRQLEAGLSCHWGGTPTPLYYFFESASSLMTKNNQTQPSETLFGPPFWGT